jgi:hypothetical protein
MSNWKGGRIKRSGYWYVLRRDHPNCGKQGYVAEHRIIMEAHIDRLLKKGEVVHHINGVKTDNRIQNLKLYNSPGQHTRDGHPEQLREMTKKASQVTPWNKNREIRRCESCKKKFEVTINSVKRFCTKQCYYITRKGVRVSKDSEFKKGTTPWNRGLKQHSI